MYGKLPYGHTNTTEMTKKFVGLAMEQLVSKKEWTWTNVHQVSAPGLGNLLFHRMIMIKGIRCPDCLDPMFMLDEEGSPLSSLQRQTKFWTRDRVNDVYVTGSESEATMPNAADTLGFWKWHLHHKYGNMTASDPHYIAPSDLPRKALKFGTLPSGETWEPEKGTRLWNYCLLQINCNKCHEQGESRETWEVDMAYVSPVYYPVPSEPKTIKSIIKGRHSSKYTAFRNALTEYRLDNSLLISAITFEELNYICVNTLEYRVQDLVTFDKKIYETTEYPTQRSRFMKMIAYNFIKKESGLCIGREGASICPTKDICNILPRRLNGIHGDHGEGAGKKKYSPAESVMKKWKEMEDELLKLDGNRCAHCHRGK